MTGTKLTGIIAASILSLLAVAYAIIFALVRSGLISAFDETDVTLFTVTDPGDVQLVDTLTIKNGSKYGWYAIIRTTQSDMTWEESFTLPSAPSSWKHTNLVRVSPDRITAYSRGKGKVMEWEVMGWKGMLERMCFVKTVTMMNIWDVVEGDPVGDYRFTVSINGRDTTKTLHVRKD